MALPELDAEEQRILGVLLEKQVTVPATYPMTLAAVRTGCNQSSSREPVVDYDEPTVEATLRRLKDRQLVRVVWADSGRRTLKYHQLLSEALELERRRAGARHRPAAPRRPGARRAAGPAPTGCTPSPTAVRSRPSSPDLAARPEPLVRELPRQRGQHDARWVHLLGDVRRDRRRRSHEAGPPSTARRCSPPAPRPATSGSGRRTTRSPTAYADHLADELARPAVRDAGCSTGSPRTPTAARSSRSAAVRAT